MIDNYLDKNRKIKCWPKKKQSRLIVLNYLVSKFDFNTIYNEKEVNKIIEENHSFTDYFLLRRELIEYKLMLRTMDGSKYWRNDTSSL